MLKRLFGPLVRELAKCAKQEWLMFTLQIRIRRFDKTKIKHEQAKVRFRTRLAELQDYIARELKP